jgi:hypothetical protein
MTEQYKVKFPIGDWSRDGHGMCDWFIVNSNKPVEELREAHFSFRGKAGFDIGDLCHEYEDSIIGVVETKFLKDNKLVYDKDMELEYLDEQLDPLEKADDFEGAKALCIFDPETLLKIWINCLMYSDPNLKLEIVTDDIPHINQYGFDKKNRHLKTPGYGLHAL